MSILQRIACVLLLICTISAYSEAKQYFKWTSDAGRSSETSVRRVRRQSSSVRETFPFDGVLAQAAVESHNEARRTVTPSSADMREMSWDDELAEIALTYSQECVFEHNPSDYHSRFLDSVGENLYLSAGLTFGETFVRNALAAWDNERFDYDYDTGACTPGKPCGHYTQMVWATSFKVGCGATLCSRVVVDDQGSVWDDATLLVCNYGTAGNIVGQTPYISGLPCDNCEDPSDTCSGDLCFNANRLNAPASASWLDWGDWDECSTTCGFNGRRYRSRMCSIFVLSDCEGFSRQVDRNCANKNCPSDDLNEDSPMTPTSSIPVSTAAPVENIPNNAPPVENECSEWTSWSSCSQSCGEGERRRTETCIEEEGSITRTRINTQIQSCQNPCSTTDSSGGFGAWGAWTQCSSLCGFGIRYRLRSCDSSPCDGPYYAVSQCQSEELC